MFGFLSGKDWNVLAVIFERTDLFTVSGQRVKGGDAVKARDGAQGHARTIFWAVFDQKGKFLEGAPGQGAQHVPVETTKKLERDLRTNRTSGSAIRERPPCRRRMLRKRRALSERSASKTSRRG